jgi:hypothetical protein
MMKDTKVDKDKLNKAIKAKKKLIDSGKIVAKDDN